MILGMKKGSATADQSKRRTTNNRLILFSYSTYHARQKMSMEKCRVCGEEATNMSCCICEDCLRRNRFPYAGRKPINILVAPSEDNWLGGYNAKLHM